MYVSINFSLVRANFYRKNILHSRAASLWGVTPGTHAGMARDLSTLGDNFKPGMRGLDCSYTFVGYKGKTCGIPCATALVEMELETLLMSI